MAGILKRFAENPLGFVTASWRKIVKMRMTGYDPASYWSQVHRSYAFGVRSSGYEVQSEWTNMVEYGRQRMDFAAILASEGLSFEGRTVFEAGVGSGVYSAIARRNGCARLEACDITDALFPNLKQYLRPECLSVCDVRQLSLRKTFDIVMCIDVIQHIPDLEGVQATIRNLWRATEGALVISPFHRQSKGTLAAHVRNWSYELLLEHADGDVRIYPFRDGNLAVVRRHGHWQLPPLRERDRSGAEVRSGETPPY